MRLAFGTCSSWGYATPYMTQDLPPDDGLFYVRVWGNGAIVETQFKSRTKALEFVGDVYRRKSYTRVEVLEALEWGTRSTTKSDR